MKLIPTKQPLGVNRMVHVYSNLWKGPRPATISNIRTVDGATDVTFNVQADGRTDRELLKMIRNSDDGNSFGNMPVLDIEELAPGEPITSEAVDEYGVEMKLPISTGNLQAMGLAPVVKMFAVWPPRL